MNLPLSYRQNSQYLIDGFVIFDADSNDICIIEKEEDAVLICNAVNNYGA